MRRRKPSTWGLPVEAGVQAFRASVDQRWLWTADPDGGRWREWNATYEQQNNERSPRGTERAAPMFQTYEKKEPKNGQFEDWYQSLISECFQNNLHLPTPKWARNAHKTGAEVERVVQFLTDEKLEGGLRRAGGASKRKRSYSVGFSSGGTKGRVYVPRGLVREVAGAYRPRRRKAKRGASRRSSARRSSGRRSGGRRSYRR